jgi:hypothetical protein
MKYRGPKATPRMLEYSDIIKNISKTVSSTDLSILGDRLMDNMKSRTKKDKLLRKIIDKYKDLNIRKDWDLGYVVVMIDSLYYKFNQNKNFKEDIMKIPDNTYIVDGSEGSEENKLGKILTAFINVIKYGDCSKMSKELLLKIKYLSTIPFN